MLHLVLLRHCYRTFIQTYSATSPFNPHWEMDKTFSPSYYSIQITYVEAEAVEFSRFRFHFHRKRTASRFHIPGVFPLPASTSLVTSLFFSLPAFFHIPGFFRFPLPHPWLKHKTISHMQDRRLEMSERQDLRCFPYTKDRQIDRKKIRNDLVASSNRISDFVL